MTLKQVAENHGLTQDGVDYALRQYQIIIVEITRGMMSKLSYDANDVLQVARKRWCDTCAIRQEQDHTFGAMAGEAIRKQFALLKQFEEGKMKVHERGNIGVSDTEYGKCPWCGADVRSDVNRNYCGNCGRQVSWDEP